MAYTSTYSASSAPAAGPFARFFSALFSGLVRIAENNPRMRMVAQLSAMSDEELAARGLKREDIVRRAFGDRMYI